MRKNKKKAAGLKNRAKASITSKTVSFKSKTKARHGNTCQKQQLVEQIPEVI